MPDQQNVVFVFADHHRADALGVVDSGYRTPNIDRLAEEGTRFENCFCTQPQCSPARSTLLTGQYPHQTGVQALPNWPPDDRYVLDPAADSLGEVFRAAGYDTAWFGRWDVGTENVGPLGWDSYDVDLTGSAGRQCLYRDRQTRWDAVDYLSGSREEPFFLAVSLNLPHGPKFEDRAFADLYDREAVPVPDTFDDDLTGKPDHHREYAGRCGLTAEDARELRYQYRTMVSRVDEMVGQVVDELREQGLLEETVVVFSSDHGDMVGAHGGMLNIHTVPYDDALQVPLIVRAPGDDHGLERGGTVDDLLSARSIPGTLIEAAGLPVPDSFEGGSLYSPERRAAATGDRVFFEHKHASGDLHPYRGVRTREWKYVEYFLGEGAELYDLESDPGERENLAGDPGHADTEGRLRTTVREWWERTGGDEESWVEPIP